MRNEHARGTIARQPPITASGNRGACAPLRERNAIGYGARPDLDHKSCSGIRFVSLVCLVSVGAACPSPRRHAEQPAGADGAPDRLDGRARALNTQPDRMRAMESPDVPPIVDSVSGADSGSLSPDNATSPDTQASWAQQRSMLVRQLLQFAELPRRRDWDPSGTVGNTCVLLVDRTITCWGWNQYGQLGDGTTVDRNRPPVKVSGLAGATTVATGGGHVARRSREPLQMLGKQL